MPRCSEEALETALMLLSEHAASGRARANWMSTYLVAQRMQIAGYPMTIAGANSGVADLFVLLPDHPRGRSNPFVDLASDYRWQQVESSGRKTVWNTGTRNGAQRVLFNQNHFSGGLRSDAIEVLLEHLGDEEPLPARDALAVLLTRNHEWAAEPSRAELHDKACEVLGLTTAEFDAITDDVRLPVSVLGYPEWSAALLQESELGPGAATLEQETPAAPTEYISVESIQELPQQFRSFLHRYGIAVGGDEELVDLLAATLSSQFVIMAGPSGTGKSLMASALAAFFAPADRRCRLESSRLLAKPQEFLGYYSHLAGETFVAYDQLLTLLDVTKAETDSPPVVTIEEANLSPMEGYLSPLVHGMGALQAETLPIRLHTQPDAVKSQSPNHKVPALLELQPYPRVFATINVDADSPAPARKVVSRACVVLLDTPSFETALAAADSLVHPSVEEANGPASALIGRPTIAFDRYARSGSDVYQQAMAERAESLRTALGVDVIAHRQLQRSLMYMAWFVELHGTPEPEQGHPVVEAAADNALLHFVLPSLPAAQFEHALDALNTGSRAGVLAQRLKRLRGIVSEHQFGPPPDFWGALS